MKRVLDHKLCLLLFAGVLCSPAGTACGAEGNPTMRLPQALIEAASKGSLSESLLGQFFAHAENQARSVGEGSEDFWNWIGAREDLRRGLLAGLHPEYNRHVIRCFDELYRTYGARLDRFAHLALAFSFVYGKAGGETIRAPWMDWVAKERPVPACRESFAFYVDNADRMLLPIDAMSWPVLLFVADNDIPIGERTWVLSHYANHSLDDLARVHSDPDYIQGKYAKKQADLEGAPMSLPRIFSEGGVCSQQAYYASRVYKCFGIPSVRLLESAHAYEGWLVGGDKLEVKYGAAMGRHDGYFLCPLRRTKNRQYQFAMCVAAMNAGYDGYIKALVASHVVNAMPNDLGQASISLLADAIGYNPYCGDTWLALARLCGEEIRPVDEGWDHYAKARLLLPNHPEAACEILAAVSDRLLGTALVDGPKEQQSNIGRLRAAAGWLEKRDRSDLSSKVLETLRQYTVTARGRLGAIDHEATTVHIMQPGCFVWRILPDVPPSAALMVSVKHAEAGQQGAFHIAAWSDTDSDGVPDKQIAISPLLRAARKDQWSSWEVSSNGAKVFVGIAQKEAVPIYYQMSGQLEGYCGLSDEVYYSRVFGRAPEKSVRPRYANIRVDVRRGLP